MTVRTFEGKTPVVPQTAFVDDTALVLGDVTLGEDVSVWPMAAIRGDIHHIRIGARTNIQDGSVLHVTHDSEFAPGGNPLEIGDDVTVGHNVVLHACRVGSLCLVGMGSVVLDGAVLQDRVMVGAGSLVSPGKELESGYLYLGQPVRQVRPLTDVELRFLEYSAAHYVELKNRHRGGSGE